MNAMLWQDPAWILPMRLLKQPQRAFCAYQLPQQPAVSYCTPPKMHIWNHLNQKQSQFPQCIIGILTWPFTPRCTASLGRGAWYKVGSLQHKYAAHCVFPSGTLKEGGTERERQSERGKKSWTTSEILCSGFWVKTFSLPQIRTFLLLWILCLLARSGEEGEERGELSYWHTPVVGAHTKGDRRQRGRTMDNASLRRRASLTTLRRALKHMCKEILKDISW